MEHWNVTIQKAFVVIVGLCGFHQAFAWQVFANAVVQYYFYIFLLLLPLGVYARSIEELDLLALSCLEFYHWKVLQFV